MPSIRITAFGGINTEIAPRLAGNSVAQIAHNCLLWDGALRPLAKWSKMQGVEFTDVTSIAISNDNASVYTSKLKDAVYLGEAYSNTWVGLAAYYPTVYDSNIMYTNALTTAEGKVVGVRKPIASGATSISYTRAYHSEKPVNRVYAVSGVRRIGDSVQESVLTVLPNQSPQSILYEGDLATINLVLSAIVPYEYSGFRLYRSISGMDTGTSVGNEFDTEWHLIADLEGGTADGINYTYNYTDGGSATTDPLDVYLASNFYPPRRKLYKYLQMLEGGWLAAATYEGQIAISERYMYHAWPSEQLSAVPEVITDCKAHDNNLYIGTQNRPYIMAVAPGEKLAVQTNIEPFPEFYACLPDTMDRTSSGVMYTSPSGVVALSREGMRLLTAGVTSGVSALYQIESKTEELVDGVLTDVTRFYPMRFQHTVYGAYLRGTYFGFCAVKTNEIVNAEPLYHFKGFMYSSASALDGDRPLQKFVTFDTPPNVRAHCVGGSGIYVLSTDGVWTMPLPDSVGEELYNRAPKYCYTWKSKKFVFPGDMVMAAAKVVHDCKGFVRLKIYVDCCCRYEVLVSNCEPFTLPTDLAGVEWEVALEGTSAVHEVHLASSLRELIEQ